MLCRFINGFLRDSTHISDISYSYWYDPYNSTALLLRVTRKVASAVVWSCHNTHSFFAVQSCAGKQTSRHEHQQQTLLVTCLAVQTCTTLCVIVVSCIVTGIIHYSAPVRVQTIVINPSVCMCLSVCVCVCPRAYL